MADLNYKAEDSVYKVKEIGGYMELELPRKESYYYGADVVDVNGNSIDVIGGYPGTYTGGILYSSWTTCGVPFTTIISMLTVACPSKANLAVSSSFFTALSISVTLAYRVVSLSTLTKLLFIFTKLLLFLVFIEYFVKKILDLGLSDIQLGAVGVVVYFG